MAQRSGLWDGQVGDGGPYATADLHDWFLRMVLNGTGNRGPLQWWLNGLAVSGTASPVTVATGAAIVYGGFYELPSPVGVSIPTPLTGTSRYDRIVVRRNWTAQQTRIARVAGVAAAAPAVPALTQTAGAIYEIPLATVLVNDSGVITVTDTREYCQFCTTWPANTVDTEHYTAGAITPAKVPNRNRWELKQSGSFIEDSANAFTWTAGGNYDYPSFAAGVTNAGWVYFMAPEDLVGASVDIYLWSVPNVNGAGGGAENVKWNYLIDSGSSGGALVNATGSVLVDQQLRVNTTVYRDQLVAAHAITAGELLILQVTRDGGHVNDNYLSAMQLLGIEMYRTADN